MQGNTQSGRSMIEMIGVLAIIGVLSIGGLEGYSMAMTSYKAHQATDEIIKIIRTGLEYFDQGFGRKLGTLGEVYNAVVDDPDVFPVDHQNVLGGYTNLPIWYDGIGVYYQLPNREYCRKLLLYDWEQEFGGHVKYIYGAVNVSGSIERILFSNEATVDSYGVPNYPLPVTVERVNETCSRDTDNVYLFEIFVNKS
jgi:type II secretory pathway pseudopilin PulG